MHLQSLTLVSPAHTRVLTTAQQDLRLKPPCYRTQFLTQRCATSPHVALALSRCSFIYHLDETLTNSDEL